MCEAEQLSHYSELIRSMLITRKSGVQSLQDVTHCWQELPEIEATMALARLPLP